MATIDPPHSRLKKEKRKKKERKKDKKKRGETNKRNQLQLHALSTHTYKERSKASKLS